MPRLPRFGPPRPVPDPSSRECERRRIPFGAMLLAIVGFADLAATLLALAAA
jgi:hypothetical protein